MAKSKKFRAWSEDDLAEERSFRPQRDGKRYDRKKDSVQQARRSKSRQRDTFFEEDPRG